MSLLMKTRKGPAGGMERYPKQMHVRMSEEELARAKKLATALGATVSDLIRILIQLPAESIEGGARLVVIGCTTAVKLSREMRRWGHHYNQAVHALNAIVYYLRVNDMESPDVIEEFDRASEGLAAMQPGIAALHGGCRGHPGRNRSLPRQGTSRAGAQDRRGARLRTRHQPRLDGGCPDSRANRPHGVQERGQVPGNTRRHGRQRRRQLAKAQRRDWIYALADHPARRISGERTGPSYGRERLGPLLRTGGIRRPEGADERAIAETAKRAVEVGNLEELRSLSSAVALMEASPSRGTCSPTARSTFPT